MVAKEVYVNVKTKNTFTFPIMSEKCKIQRPPKHDKSLKNDQCQKLPFC